MNAEAPSEIKVLSGGAVRRGLESLAQSFERETGHKTAITFATAPVLRQNVESGEDPSDVIVVPAPMMKNFETSKRVVSGLSTVIGSVKAGVVVRQGPWAPDISSAAAFKKEIIDCNSLVYNEGSSGIFVEKLLERLGVAADVKSKTTRLPDADGVMKFLASSKTEKEIGFGQLTAIALYTTKGVMLVGPLPEEIENVTVYAAGVAAGASAPEPAATFVRYLVTPSAKEVFKAAGVE